MNLPSREDFVDHILYIHGDASIELRVSDVGLSVFFVREENKIGSAAESLYDYLVALNEPPVPYDFEANPSHDPEEVSKVRAALVREILDSFGFGLN